MQRAHRREVTVVSALGRDDNPPHVDRLALEVLAETVVILLLTRHTVVPDERVREGEDLPAVTGVCETFRIPRHARVKDHFTIRINISGKLPHGCYSKDVVLTVAKKMGSDGANYRVIEYGGGTVESFNVPARLTLTNMSAEMGAKAAIVPPDDHTREYLIENDRLIEFEEIRSDPDAQFERMLHFDISNLKPMIACPPDIDNDVPVEEVQAEKIRVDQVFIGSCTNCRIEDLEVVYGIWKGKRLKEGLRVIVTPASRKVYIQALKRGYIEDFMKIGAVVSSPGCGPCLGRAGGVLYDNEVCVSTSNRNFEGRMGSPKAKIYLASPATAAASALTGFITDPRDYIN